MTEEDARAARYRDLFEESHDHPSNCSYCPICSTIGVVRKTRPEILDHLAAAARELITAAGILLDEASTVVAAHDGVVSTRPPERDGVVSTRPPERDGVVSTEPPEQDAGRVRRIDIA